MGLVDYGSDLKSRPHCYFELDPIVARVRKVGDLDVRIHGLADEIANCPG
jgi:hypothetical protein